MSHEKLLMNVCPASGAKLRLICFPYAGGSSATYIPWVNELPKSVELHTVELPGRSIRFGEPAYTDMARLIEDLQEAFQGLVDKPYVLMGHSLGSRVAFELLHELKKMGLKMPEHFIASGSPAPHVKEKQKKLYLLPTEEFIQELRKLNGTPEEILENDELMTLSMPFIRADFELSETPAYTGTEQLDCPITVFHGDDDEEVTEADAQAWENHFTQAAVMHIVPGDHFFIEKNQDYVLEKVNFILNHILNADN